jgi:hypothetical protein
MKTCGFGTSFLSRGLDLDRARPEVTTETVARRTMAMLPDRKNFEIKARGGEIGKAEYPSPDFNHIGGHVRFSRLVLTR